MEFKLGRLEVSEQLKSLAIKKIREQKIDIPSATKKNLTEIALVVGQIEKVGLPEYLVLKKLPMNLGSGIFLHPEAKAISKGTVIAPYSGEVSISPRDNGQESDYLFSLLTDLLLTRDEQLLFDPKNKFHPRRFYALDLDAHTRGNFSRFINHGSKPNVEADLLRVPKNSVGLDPSPCEIIYIAKKKILPGEQLLVSYEGDDKSYWGPLKIKPFPMVPKTFRLNVGKREINPSPLP